MDRHVVHCWRDFGDKNPRDHTFIVRGEGIYVWDSEGKRYTCGPGGMWLMNIGYGRRHEMFSMLTQDTADAVEIEYVSHWSMSNSFSARLANKLASLSPGDLNNVFFSTSGSEAVDSALRFVAFYNNCLGRFEKKKIIARENPLRISPPKKKIENNAKRVVTDVIKVLDKVSLIEIFVNSKIFISEYFLKFSLTLSKITTVSFIE